MRYASEKQINFINSLQRYISIGTAALEAGISPSTLCLELEDWSSYDASKLIDAMIQARDSHPFQQFGGVSEVTEDMFACLDC